MNRVTLFRTSAALWAIWGVFHLIIGIYLLYLLNSGRVAEALHGIAGQMDLSALDVDYPLAAVATLKQHAYNLGWFGLVTSIGSVWVWRQNVSAAALCAIIGGLGDIGYFLFIDLGGLAVPPGPQMTWIAAAAIALSAYAVIRGDSKPASSYS